MEDFTTEELTEAFEYLDELRASGLVNMWASHAFLARDLLWPNKAASDATGLWMDTFDADKSVRERVAIAMAPRQRRIAKTIRSLRTAKRGHRPTPLSVAIQMESE